METAAKIYPKRERFWVLSRKQSVQQFALKIKPVRGNIFHLLA
jgi:hypothetical protein